MKHIIILVLSLFYANTILNSQTIEVTYIKKEKMSNEDLNNPQISDLLKKEYSQYQKERSKMRKYYILTYDDGISEYKFSKVENARPRMSMSNTITYKDLQQGLIYTSGGAMKSGEAILRNIKKELKWTYSKETKEIAGFKCLKASYTKENGQQIIAWYTTEIPIADGPSIYAGLPGLIVQLESKTSILKIANVKELAKGTIKVEIPEFTQFTSYNDYRKSVLSSYQKN